MNNKMNVAKRIKHECFCAFIHSRLTNAGNKEDEGVVILSESDNVKVDSYGDYLIEYFGKIATVDTINHKIKSVMSQKHSTTYFKNYSKLLKLLEQKIKKDEEIISPVVALAMILDYIEDDGNYNRHDLNRDKINEMYDVFLTKIGKEHKPLLLYMLETGSYVFEKYWNKKIKINY